MRARWAGCAAALAALVAACAGPTPHVSPEPLPELAEEAQVLPEDERPTGPAPSPTPTRAPSTAPTTADDPTTAPATPRTPASPTATSRPTQTPGAAPQSLAEARDPAGDAGLESPGYADVVRIVVEDTGTAARVSVDLAGDVPAALADGEVIGLGIDWFTSGGEESDVQLFADGGSDGWRAYLQTSEGFVDYPGTFAIGGRRIRFEVPWTALGAPVQAEVSAFLDWSERRTLLNASGADRVPDRGRMRVDRS